MDLHGQKVTLDVVRTNWDAVGYVVHLLETTRQQHLIRHYLAQYLAEMRFLRAYPDTHWAESQTVKTEG